MLKTVISQDKITSGCRLLEKFNIAKLFKTKFVTDDSLTKLKTLSLRELTPSSHISINQNAKLLLKINL